MRLLTLVLAGAAAAVDAIGATVVVVVVAEGFIFTSGFVDTLGESLEALVATKEFVEEAFERKTRHVMKSFKFCK